MATGLSYVVLACFLALSAYPAEEPDYEEAWRLEQKGDNTQAFLEYLTIAGCEHAALRVAKDKATGFLALLEQLAAELPAPRVSLVKAGLLLELGRKDEALAACRAALARIETKPAKDWDAAWAQGLMPAHWYPAEPAKQTRRRRDDDHSPCWPFSRGPGSDRDNWLIRCFLALDAPDDAAKEFARIWEVHRAHSQVRETTEFDGDPATEKKFKITPCGFNGMGLQFAVDYAVFLKRQKQDGKALTMLLEPFLAMDMDKNPNVWHYEGELPTFTIRRDGKVIGYWGPTYLTNGITKKDFVRLAYSEFKTSGKEEQLTAALEERIAKGENRLRRVLARVRFHQGRPDDALKLEFEYIAAGNYDPVTNAWRRGVAADDVGKTAEAVAEFEKLLALPYQPPQLLEPEEEVERANGNVLQDVHVARDPKTPEGREEFLKEVTERLKRLYGALNQPDRALDYTLKQCELAPSSMERPDVLEQVATRFRATGQGKRFEEWLRATAPKIANPKAQANMYWMAKDTDAAIAAWARVPRDTKNEWQWNQWKKRFSDLGEDKLRTLLTAHLAADPGDARTRLELMELTPQAEKTAAIEPLETLLSRNVEELFPMGGRHADTQYEDTYDIAYRLMCLYEKGGHGDKIIALGLRIARGEKPFSNDKYENANHFGIQFGNRWPEHANACLALAIQHLSAEKDIAAFKDALANSPWEGARSQLARRAGGKMKLIASKPVGWANVPAGTTLLASSRNVLALATDERYVYAGHPWGVAVYDLRGEPVARVPLGEAAKALAAADGVIWAGTPAGLFKIDCKDWSVSFQRFTPPAKGYAASFGNNVTALALDGELLWIALNTKLQVLNTKTLQLRAFSFPETGRQVLGRSSLTRILPEKDYVWIAGPHVSLCRYDRKADALALVQYEGRPVSLLGDIEGTLFGSARMPEPERGRLCTINRETLEVTLIQLAAPKNMSEYLDAFSYYGKHKGQMVFGDFEPKFVLEGDGKTLRPLNPVGGGGGPWHDSEAKRPALNSDLPEALCSGSIWRGGHGVISGNLSGGGMKPVFGQDIRMYEWNLAVLPDGSRVLGVRCLDYPADDFTRAMRMDETNEAEGGLFFIDPAGKARCVSAADRADALRGDIVYAIVPWQKDDQKWLCTNLGLELLNRDNAVTAHFARSKGLLANRVLGGVECRGKFYFACAYDKAGGGLIVFDPVSSAFTALLRQDGLDSNKVVSVTAKESTLTLTYGSEISLDGIEGPQRARPGTFDVETGQYKSGGPMMATRQDDTRGLRKQPRELVPYLGGHLLSRLQAGEKEFLCGTRGLVVRQPGAAAPPPLKELGANLVNAPPAKEKEAGFRPGQLITSPEDLAQALKDPNPDARASALTKLPRHWDSDVYWEVGACREGDAYLKLISSQVQDPDMCVRYRAFCLLLCSPNDQKIIPLLRRYLEDKVRYLQEAAAIELARRGQFPNMKLLEEVAANWNEIQRPDFGNIFIVDLVNQDRIEEALSLHATPEVFGILVKHLPRLNQDGSRSKIYSQLGAALRQYPEAAGILLKAKSPKADEYSEHLVFILAVFKNAGKEMLPVLHQALENQDPVVSANAARACGVIGDSSSIPPLMKALDIEVMRNAVVWALGELKAKEAQPRLIALYGPVVEEMQSRYGRRGFLSQAEEEEFNRQLKPGTILEAIRKIGADTAGEFFRNVSAKKGWDQRTAAEALAEGAPAEREQNLAALKELLGSEDRKVRVSAVVSMFILGYEPAQKQILEWLGGQNADTAGECIKQLARVQPPAKLEFAREALNTYVNDPGTVQGYRLEAIKLFRTLNRR